MKQAIWTVLVGLLAGSAATAGTITGTVSGKGPTIADSGGGDGKYASRRYKFAERVDYSRLDDFVIYINQAVPEPAGAPAPPLTTITQHNVNFEPHVLPIVVGTRVRWPNADDIYHNIFSMSETKDFNLGLYLKIEKPPEILFDQPGQVDVFCSIHSKMHCIILVLPSRFFAKVGTGQRYFIRDVPAGTYKLKAWHERLPARTRDVTVPDDGEVKADFTLGFAAAMPPKN